MRSLVRGVAHVAFVSILIFLMSRHVQAQHSTAANSPAENGPITNLPSNAVSVAVPSRVNIFYTSQLYGYFRTPDAQPGDSTEGCSAGGPDSPAATAFNDLWGKEAVQGDVLVGTGNNLAPVLRSREFDSAPKGQSRHWDPKAPAPKVYERAGKELFAWDPIAKKWLTNELISDKRYPEHGRLVGALRKGDGTIPTDNVSCFLRRAGYAAIVPGKYDFYYGPERLRELARFLASDPEGEKFKPVQMLGANLVIETTWRSDHKPVGDSEDPPRFAPWITPRYKDSYQPKLEVPTVTSPRDGAKVYPWFPGAELHLVDLPETSDLLSKLRENKRKTRDDFKTILTSLASDPMFLTGENKRELDTLTAIVVGFPLSAVYLCGRSVPGNPNKILIPGNPSKTVDPGNPSCSAPLDEPEVRLKGTAVEYFYPFPQISEFATLLAGANYGLCLKSDKLFSVSAKADEDFYCARFSVYTPFFQYPSTPPPTYKDSQGKEMARYKVPEPYTLVPSNGHPEKDVAIFGVVDPKMGQEVGMLNFTWSNSNNNSDDKKFKTETVVEDPGEALKEIVGYFERRYSDKHQNREFEGVKILLAQMTPGESQKLAVRVGGFDVVVSDADSQLSAVGEIRTAKWKPDHPDPKDHHAFLAVPQPYWVSDKHPTESVDLGKLTIDIGPGVADKTFSAVHKLEERTPHSPGLMDVEAPVDFWDSVVDYINTQCHAEFKPKSGTLKDGSPDSDKQTALESLSACAMQEKIGSDVVLLQKRDFYLDWQQRFPGRKFKTFQQFLDRVIWKGDFLTLLYVPGSTLQSVMKQSKVYDDDDKSLLSLSGETNRGLVTLGIRLNSNTGQYLINEVPLDPTRVYAVSTSDFIATGDTGYPDLAANAIRQFSTPRDFDSQLRNISGVVCQRLPLLHSVTSPPPPLDSGGKPADTCMDAIDRDSYFDELAVLPTDIRQGDTDVEQLREWSIFDRRKHVPGSTGNKGVSENPERVEKFVEQRRLGSIRVNQPDSTLFAIDDAALSLNVTNHKLSDSDLAKAFVGNPTPQLSAKRSHTIGYDIQPKFLYSWHTFQLFENTEMRYNEQDTGNLNAPRTVNQKENLFSSDTGFARDILDRTLPHLEILGTFHYETQIERPTAVTLAPLPKGDTFVAGVDTSRTHYFLPRVGLRYVNRTSWIEAGIEGGRERNAVRLVPPTGNSTEFGLLRKVVPVSGTYWKWHLVVPFGQKVSWTVDEDGDFFFNQTGDTTTDTRFRSDTKTSVNFQVFPSVSFAPTYEFFYYSNKVDQSWFWQNQASIQLKVRYDFWNRHRPWDQFNYKAASGKSQ